MSSCRVARAMKHTRTEFEDYTEERYEPDDPSGDDGAKTNEHNANTGADTGEAPWPTMAPAAYNGLAGEVVSDIAPYTEADPVALLLHFFASFGNAVGRGPHYLVEATSHFANLFLVTIGRTSRARKGTGADWISRIFEIADPHWAHNCIHSGLSSGEGMLTPIRDPVYVMKKGVEKLTDPGVEDKRMLLDEREFSQVLRVMRREGNVVSRMVRDAWDCREVIGTLTKHNRTKVTKAYISISGHITAEELRSLLDQTEMFNGFANRFLLACVCRSKLLPHGGAPSFELIKKLGQKTLQAIEGARSIKRVIMTPEAAGFWRKSIRCCPRTSPACSAPSLPAPRRKRSGWRWSMRSSTARHGSHRDTSRRHRRFGRSANTRRATSSATWLARRSPTRFCECCARPAPTASVASIYIKCSSVIGRRTRSARRSFDCWRRAR